MKQYYIFINEEQLGPFNIEELKNKKISRETKVWFEGLENWKNATEIEELKPIFSSIPPPINSFTSIPPTPKTEKKQTVHIEPDDEDETPKILGLKKNIFFGILGVLVLLIGIMYFNNVQENNRIKLMQQNQQTETHNQQLELQQKEIEEQNARLAEQEKIEAQRKEKERIAKLEAYYGELNESLNTLYNNLAKEQKRLNDVTSFKLLRTSSERNAQINEVQTSIDFIKENIKIAEDEMVKVNKQLGIK